MLARCAELWECGAQKSQSSHGAPKGRLHVQGTGKGGGGVEEWNIADLDYF